jgi:hypothetical protein
MRAKSPPLKKGDLGGFGFSRKACGYQISCLNAFPHQLLKAASTNLGGIKEWTTGDGGPIL